jgi:pyridinium-3,5-bisthiocarboxylic acid mononucleotide nickel chelatase
MNNILYIDAFSGISGDKMVASLLALGVDFELFRKELAKLQIEDEYEIALQQKKVMGILSNYFKVILHDHHHNHTHREHVHGRNLNDILKMINSSEITENSKIIAAGIFTVLAEAESKIHGEPVDKIHFHEVGAVDSILDIVGTAILLDLLKIETVYSSPIPTGNGFVNTQHGLLPVPAPATAELLTGIPSYKTEIQGELTTPTGAAIVKYLAKDFKYPDIFISEKIGYGAGTKEFSIPNVLKLEIGSIDKHSENSTIMKLETNIDDCTPEQLAFLSEKLFLLNALDVFNTPVYMKKGRIGTLMTVLCNENDRIAIEKEIFLNSTTFGIRRQKMERSILKREFKTIEIDNIKIRIKFGYMSNVLIHKTLEYEDVKEFTLKKNITYNEAVNLINEQIKKI